MQRFLLAALLTLAAGCGGRTGLGVFTDGGWIYPDDAAPGDAAVVDGGLDDAADAAPQRDGPGRLDASTGKNCAQVMMCVFDSLTSGFDWQAMLQCTQGASIDGLAQGGQLIYCLASNCGQLLMSDGGGQFDILMCLLGNCQDQLCSCDGIDALVPPGILTCP
jgi:hypothetical protein